MSSQHPTGGNLQKKGWTLVESHEHPSVADSELITAARDRALAILDELKRRK